MKCQNLMVGDLVGCEHGWPMQVTSVGNDYAYANIECKEGDVLELDDKLDPPMPILIKREILEKNGFVWEKSTYDYDFGLALLWLKEKKTYIEWKNSSKTIAIWLDYDPHNDGVYADIVFPVKYVHEMQQVLRLAGLEDVADNFKISHYEND